jgi:hypothetical protein
MSVFNLRTFVISSIILSLFSCDKEPTEPSGETQIGSSHIVFESPLVETSNIVGASFNGEILCSVETDYSLDGGTTWKSLSPGYTFGNDVQVNNNQFLFSGGNSPSLIDLNLGYGVNFPNLQTYNPQYFMGVDEYMYAADRKTQFDEPQYLYRSFDSPTWDTLLIKGVFAGADQNGGIAIYNPNTKNLYIHTPATNTIATYNLTNAPSPSGKSTKYAYNGFDKLAIGYTTGVTILDLDGSANHQTWPSSFSGFIDNPLMLDINKEGDVFAQIIGSLEPQTNIKLKDNAFSIIASPEMPYAKGNYTYTLEPLEIQKTSANSMVKIKTGKGVKRRLESATVSNGSIFTILSPLAQTNDYIFMKKSNAFTSNEIITNTNQYKYVYSDANSVYAFSADSIMYTRNNGATWSTTENNGLAFTHVSKINNTYYGLYSVVDNYNSPNGHIYPQFDLAVYSSYDCLTWTKISSTENKAGYAPSVISPNGTIGYINNLTPESNATLILFESHDFGLTWDNAETLSNYHTLKPDGNYLSFDQQSGGKILFTTHSSIAQEPLSTSEVILPNSNIIRYLFYSYSGDLYGYSTEELIKFEL